MLEDKAYSIIHRFSGKRVLIVGDVMLDEYIYGDVHRISPEAPVPVVEIQRRNFIPGGAANTATNIAELGGQALLYGVVGDDPQAKKLRDVISERENLHIELFVDHQRRTTTKTRIIAHNQQVVRIDYETRDLIETGLEERILASVETLIEKVDACILSDYNKGMLTLAVTRKLIEMARAAGKPVVIDPKSPDFSKYRLATIVTPNLHEAERATNGIICPEKNLLQLGRRLQDILEGSAVLITRGSEGMTLFSEESIIHIPALARNVYDVTGAGDTVVSVLALSLAAGAELDNAAYLANLAAGIVIGKAGTATVSPDEIMHSLQHYSH